MLTIKEKEYHRSRVAFAICDDSVLYLFNSDLGHKEWLVDGGILTEVEFDTTVRGFVKDNEFYFYVGDFKTDLKVEKEAKKYIKDICSALFLEIPKHVYCGMNKGKVGELWTPTKKVML